MNRRRFLKCAATGLLLPAAPAIVKGQAFSFRDLPFMAKRVSPVNNGLLNGLTSYWKFDVDVSPYADSIGSNPLTGNLTNAAVAGIINTGLSVLVGSSYAAHATNSDFSMGAGVSFTYSLWIYATGSYNNTSTYATWLTKGDDQTGNNQYELMNFQSASYQLVFCAWDTLNFVACVPLTATNTPPTPGVWHHCVIGFDSATQQIFAQYDGGTRATANMTSNGIRALGGDFRLGLWAGAVLNALPNQTIDECGLWRRALSTADVTALNNAGAGLPLSSFTA